MSNENTPTLRVIGEAKMTGAVGGKTWFLAVMAASLAKDSGLLVTDDSGTFFVPPGTPWQEALPLY